MQRQIEWQQPAAPIHSNGEEQRTKEAFFSAKQRLLLLRQQFEAKEAEG